MLGGFLFLAACSNTPSIGPRTATGLPTHVDGGSGQILRFCERMHDAGDLTTAAATCEQAHRLNPSAPAPLLELASILGEMNEPDLSIAAYRAILKTSPANADARYGLGRTYLSQGQSDLALIEFQAALKSNPRDPRLYSAVGVAKGLLGDHKEAQKTFRDGLSVVPQDTALRNNLGLSLVQSGRYDQGLRILETLAKDSESEQASHDNLLLVQGLAASARAEIMLAEAQAEAEAIAEAQARAAALEAAKPETQDRSDPSEAAKVASAPATLDFSFPRSLWPMDGPGESGVAPKDKLASKTVPGGTIPGEARHTRIARALASRPEPEPMPLTAPTALTKAMVPPPASPTASAAPRTKPAKLRTQAVLAPRSLTNLKDRQTARADFGATSDAGTVRDMSPRMTVPNRHAAAMPRPNAPTSTAEPAKDTYAVQFASYTNEERAWRGWDSLRGSAHGLLNDIEPDVSRADLGGDMGTVYRLRTRPTPQQKAKTLCSALQAEGIDCLVLKSKPEIAESNAGAGPTTL